MICADFNQVVANIAPGLQLFVMPSGKAYTASLIAGEWPSGQHITCTVFTEAKVIVEEGEPASLWLGETSVRLPWLELLKVADFLNLEIPLPHPLGEQVPA